MTSNVIFSTEDEHNLTHWYIKLFSFKEENGQRYKPLYGTRIRPYFELGKLYCMGLIQNLNYESAIYYIEAALKGKESANLSSEHTFRSVIEKEHCESAMYHDVNELDKAFNGWNDETITRIKILKYAHFDSLLNRLGAQALISFDPALTTLLINLRQASNDFMTQKNPNLVDAKKMFGDTTIKAIGNIHKDLVTNDITTLLTEILGAIVSICTLGIANYATDRSMYGLFSSRIDTAVKLSNLVTELQPISNSIASPVA